LNLPTPHPRRFGGGVRQAQGGLLVISLHDVSWLSRRCRCGQHLRLSATKLAPFFFGRTGRRPAALVSLPPEKAVRRRQSRQGTGHHGGFAVCGFTATAAKYFDLCNKHRLTVISGSLMMSEFLHDIPNLEGSREFRPLASLFFYLAGFASSEGTLNTGSSKLNSHQCDCRPPRDGKH
jgi:hypothetical protein